MPASRASQLHRLTYASDRAVPLPSDRPRSWYPRPLRRSSNVWDRLPRSVRRFRLFVPFIFISLATLIEKQPELIRGLTARVEELKESRNRHVKILKTLALHLASLRRASTRRRQRSAR